MESTSRKLEKASNNANDADSSIEPASKRRKTSSTSAFALMMRSAETSSGEATRDPYSPAKPQRRRESNNSSNARRRRRSSTASPAEQDHHQPSEESNPSGPLEPVREASNSSQMTVHHIKADLFTCAPGSLMVHACNCKGSWGAGVAAAFKKKYPEHYQVYATYCRKRFSKPAQMLGTALLIPPSAKACKRGQTDWVGCLFTRVQYGAVKGKSLKQDVKEILEATECAWGDLLRQVRDLEREEGDGETAIGDIVMPKINGGLFRVPWEKTEEVLRKGGEEGSRREFWVYDPSG